MNIKRLKGRIERNYAEFKAEMLSMGEEDIFDLANRISAVCEAYHQMTEHGYVDEDDAVYLLKFHNPLEMIADYLEGRRGDNVDEFDEALYELFEQDDNEDCYITAELAEKLRRKHGAGTNIKAAVLSEAAEAGEQYRRLLKLINGTGDEGVDFCIIEE